MRDVAVWILHPEAAPSAGPLERAVVDARAAIAEAHRTGFERAGAASVRIVAGPPDDTPFGARLRGLVAAERPGGVVVLGSGAVPLATGRDRAAWLRAAGSAEPTALANNRYSADVIAVPCADRLLDLPDLPADNGLPRWLETRAGYAVADQRASWRLAVDIDGPLDLVLLGGRGAGGVSSARSAAVAAALDGWTDAVRGALSAVATVARDRAAELLIAGRTSGATLRHLEGAAAGRVRALVEERGLRTADPAINRRPPRSVLGLLLDRDGPEALGEHLSRLADAALLDTRVLIAHQFGADPRGWPPPEDRFASDLLVPDGISDPWLRALTASARDAAIPVVLGGHTLVGPGTHLLIGSPRWS